MKIIKTQHVENKEYDPRMYIENPKYNPRMYIEVNLFKDSKNKYFWGFLKCETDKKELIFEKENIIKLRKIGYFENEKLAIRGFRKKILKANDGLRELI